MSGCGGSVWPTPMAGTPAQNGNSAAGNSDFSRRAEALAASILWSTPTTVMTREGWTFEEIQARQSEVKAKTLAKGSQTGNGFGLSLAAQATMWGTPRRTDAGKGAPNQTFGSGGTPLPAQAAQWPTPSARDYKGENGADHLKAGTGRKHMDQLPNAVAHGWHHPCLPMHRAGSRSWPTVRTLRPLLRLIKSSASPVSYPAILRGHARPKLNPLFVEWLMGWPGGHALCDCSATEFTRWQRDMRGALCRLPWAFGPWIWSERVLPKMIQGSLFDALD